jgi:hypothetical protein
LRQISSKFRLLIFVNIFFVVVIYADLILPEKEPVKEKFRWTYSSVKNIPGYKTRGGKEISNFIECQNGNIYKIGFVPAEIENLKEGEDIEISKTLIFSKVKSVITPDKEIFVLFTTQKIILIGVFFSMLVFASRFFLTNNFLDLIFAFASVFIYFITGVYLFYQ